MDLVGLIEEQPVAVDSSFALCGWNDVVPVVIL
jgi:hypothetical protein